MNEREQDLKHSSISCCPSCQPSLSNLKTFKRSVRGDSHVGWLRCSMDRSFVNRFTPCGEEDTTNDLTLKKLEEMVAELPDLDVSSHGLLDVSFQWQDMLVSHVECVRKSRPDPLLGGEGDLSRVILEGALGLYNQGRKNTRDEPPLIMTRDDTSATKRLEDRFVRVL